MKHFLIPAAWIVSILPILSLSAADSSASKGIDWIPAEAFLSAEIWQPARLLDPLLSEQTKKRIAGLPVYQQFEASPKSIEIRQVLGFLEMAIGRDWQTGLRQALGGGLTFAAGPRQRTLLIIEAEDQALLEKLQEIAVQIATSEAEKAGQPENIQSSDLDGIQAWTVNGKSTHALVGRELLVASDTDLLKKVVNLQPQSATSRLSSTAGYQAARQAIPTDCVGMLYVNLQALRRVPAFERGLAEQRENPLAALLLAGLTGPLQTANWLGLGLQLQADGLVAHIRTEPLDAAALKSQAFTLPTKNEHGAKPNMQVPRQIAGLSLYRDLHAFYAAKDALFPDRTSGLIFFENMMGIFFTGRDLTEDVMREFHPDLRVVAARQTYDMNIGTPDPQLPAFALVMRLRDPEQFGEVMEEAWQKALGLVNFTRGQQAEPGLILDRPSHGGVTMTTARFSAADTTDRNHLDQRYNFRPTLALPPGYAVLSSTEGLACDLVDALAREQTSPPPVLPSSPHSLLQIEGPQVSRILAANRSALVRENMIKEGHNEAEAELAIGTLLAVAENIDRLSLELGAPQYSPQATLRLKFTQP